MSEEGVEDMVEGLLRQSLVAGSQLAEQLARARAQSLRKAEQQGERARLEAQRSMVADRAVMRAIVLPVTRDDWWASAKPEQMTQAYLMAQAWKDHDPDALAASEKIGKEVKERYGIDTADLNGDGVYLQDRLAVQQIAEQQQKVAREHAEAMVLVAAALAEDINRRAAELHEQMEQHRVPREYLANSGLVAALEAARDAAGTDVAQVADRVVAGRMHLIDKDGIDGPSIGALRAEVGLSYPGAGDAPFADAGFVAAARDWHEAKTLAEGGFGEQDEDGFEARLQSADNELFTRLGPLDRDIENQVFKDPNTTTPPLVAPTGKATAPTYGSPEYYAGFGASLQGAATDAEIKGRVAAARSQAKHPSEAVKTPQKAPKARKATAGVGVGREKNQDGPTR